MKKFTYLIFLAAAFSAAKAQDTTDYKSRGYGGNGMDKTFFFSIGIEPSLPIGNFRNYSSFGLGGSLQGEFKPGSAVGVTLNAGFIDYFGKTVETIKYPDFKYVPVMAGVKVYIGDAFYIHGQAGPGFGMNGLGTSFWYGGGPGISVARALDVELKYTGWKQSQESMSMGGYSGTGSNPGSYYGGHYSVLGLRVAYNF